MIKNGKLIIFPFDRLEAPKVMRVDQLNAGKNMWVNNIPFKTKFFNYFLQDTFYRVLWMKKQRKNNYLPDKIARGVLGGRFYRIR